MRLSDMFRLGKSYFVLGLVLVLLSGIIFSISYFFVYKKVMKGTKRPNKRFILLALISIGYLAVVFGAVFLRYGNHPHSLSFHFFSSYKAAWNNFSSAAWRGILLNILLFIPFGFILPLWGEKLRTFWKVVSLGLLFTISIETIQYIGSLGVMDIDDVFNNTLGVAIGYGIVMILMTLKSKKHIKSVTMAMYSAPAIITILVSAAIVISYSTQEFGNLSHTYNYAINMRNITATGILLSQEDSKATVYKTAIASEEETHAFAIKFFSKTGDVIDDKQSNIYDETAMYFSIDNDVSLSIDYKGLTYSYRNHFDRNSKKDTAADEETIRAALSALGVEIPEKSTFTVVGNGRYEFHADMINTNGGMINGYLTCEYDIDGTIRSIVNDLLTYKAAKECSIISADKAYQMILAGKFNYYGDIKSIKTIRVQGYKLIYSLDSKGFYQPIYKFHVLINDNETYIFIPALY